MTKIPRPEQVAGWMTLDCIGWLSAQGAVSSTMIEIGCWRGRSTLALMSRSKGRLYAVDTWTGTVDDPEQNQFFLERSYVYQDFRKNLEFYIKRGQVVPLQMTSADAATVLHTTQGRDSMDLIFIDGDHRYLNVLEDLEAYTPLIKLGGILAGHDYGTKQWPGVKKAVNKFFGPKSVQLGPGSIWFWKRRS